MRDVGTRVIASAGLFFGVAFFGRVATGTHPEHAVIRLAWRTAGEKVRICKELSPEERAKIAVHMRRDAGCVSRILPYRLTVELDGEKVADSVIEPAGIHGDRPLFVQAEFKRAPGTHSVKVVFEPEPAGLDAGGHDPAWMAAVNKAPHFVFAGDVEAKTGRIALIALDPAGSRLVVY